MTKRVPNPEGNTGASQSGVEVAGAAQGASGSESAASAQAQNQQVAQQGSGDSVDTSRVEALESELQQTRENMRRLQSSMDQQVSQTEQRYQEQLREERQRRRAAEVEGLDDVERLSHELQWAQEDNQRLERQLRQREQQEQTLQVANSWADEAIRLGVDPRKIDRSDPQATLDSALQGIRDMAAQARTLESQPTTQQQTQQTRQPTDQNEEKTPPAVLTDQSGRTDTGPTTPGEVVKQFNEQRRGGRDDWTWPDIKDAVRYGQVDRSVVDNVIRSRAEAFGEGQQ